MYAVRICPTALYEEQGARIDRIGHVCASEKNIPVAIMPDTKGPAFRTKTKMKR